MRWLCFLVVGAGQRGWRRGRVHLGVMASEHAEKLISQQPIVLFQQCLVHLRPGRLDGDAQAVGPAALTPAA